LQPRRQVSVFIDALSLEGSHMPASGTKFIGDEKGFKEIFHFGEINSASEQTFSEFIKYSLNRFPAERLTLVISAESEPFKKPPDRYIRFFSLTDGTERRASNILTVSNAIREALTVAEGNLTLTWSGASAGAGNAIIGYEIEYSDSSDGSIWGSWTLLKTISSSSTSGSTSASPPATRGDYRRFRIRTLGTAGSSYYSNWKNSANSVRKNILPTPPSTFTVSPTLYETPSVTITWSGTIPGTSQIKHYVIQRSTSYMENPPWSSYETLATIVSSETSGTYITEASNIPGTATRYRIGVTDTLDAVSAYVISNTVRKNSTPTAPTIGCSMSGKSTYNITPLFMIRNLSS